ncbi:MAG: pseudouridine synthase [Eubacterium sp.]
MIRLDKYISDNGYGSRSLIKELIKKGCVLVDDNIVTNAGYLIDPVSSVIQVNGNKIEYSEHEYFMLNKPAGVVSAVTDKRDITVISLIKDAKHKKLAPVGRLDKDTEGLLLITDDGVLAHRLISPKKHIAKTYLVHINGKVDDKHIKLFKEGFKVDNSLDAMPSEMEIVTAKDDFSEVMLTIYEGKFHQIKRMFASIGYKVIYLKRISMGKLKLDERLRPGEYRKLTEEEIECLKK